ncbi:MAG: hypothetical protein DWQ04_35155 [Chloroflexi bacterium]|nr:MAG: hypothetical protein DWQ04_35155 [Chloroflexota bacterium]
MKYGFVLLFIIGWGISACTNRQNDNSNNIASQINATETTINVESLATASQTNEISDLSTPSSILNSTLSDFPLQLGNSWIYSHTAYFGEEIATYLITDTVKDARTNGNYYIAEMGRDWKQVSGTLASDDVYGLGVNQYWYIVDGLQVYVQLNQLDLSTVESSWLEYIFPLDNSIGSWYPSGEQRSSEYVGFSGHRRIYSLVDMKVPAGEFRKCPYILTFYNNGRNEDWFCPGIGLVARKFDHQGTKYGYHTNLVEYSINE